MSRPILEIRDVSKAYQLGAIGATSLRDELTRVWGRMAGHARSSSLREFWALRNVTLDVPAGQVLGIIGRNGAGKSTLLKIVSRITRQTSGEIVMRGRVASLLEIGTGFHPDLSGRENVFLNGAILGMTKAEIRAKLDEIVAFAEIDQFLDTPVKRYSSGMYVRLAFAVAAHLEPEILIVDEVLAVGDLAFQQKCLGRMNSVAGEGRTVLFVSHNMGAIRSLCHRAVLLDAGRAISDGPAHEVIDDYVGRAAAFAALPLHDRSDRTGTGDIRLTEVGVESVDRGGVIGSKSRLKITLSYRSESTQPVGPVAFVVGIYDYTNIGIYALNSETASGLPAQMPPEGRLTVVTDPINLTEGHCYVNLAVKLNGVMADYVQHAVSFQVSADEFQRGAKPPTREWVLCPLNHDWSLEACANVALHQHSRN